MLLPLGHPVGLAPISAGAPALLARPAMVEPSAWEAWTLQDVGLFDAALLASGAAAFFFISTGGTDEGREVTQDAVVAPASSEEGRKGSMPTGDPNELRPFADLRPRPEQTKRGGDPGMRLTTQGPSRLTIQRPRLTQSRLAAGALAAALAARVVLVSAALPPDASGTWAIVETRGGQKCTATLMLQPSRLAQSAADLSRGAARYQGECVDSADGSWLVQEGRAESAPPRLAWRLEYERSTVFFAVDVATQRDGALGGANGEVYAAPRADPKALRKVGTFSARRVNTAFDLRDASVARMVTEKLL